MHQVGTCQWTIFSSHHSCYLVGLCVWSLGAVYESFFCSHVPGMLALTQTTPSLSYMACTVYKPVRIGNLKLISSLHALITMGALSTCIWKVIPESGMYMYSKFGYSTNSKYHYCSAVTTTVTSGEYILNVSRQTLYRIRILHVCLFVVVLKSIFMEDHVMTYIHVLEVQPC